MRNTSVVVGLSGGVDSAVAAWLLKESGYNVIGVTMQLWQEGNPEEDSIAAVADAKRVAEHLGIPHYVMNFHKEFRSSVMDYFTEEYLHGRTPNPCVVCNRRIKWEALMKRAAELGAEYLATGHYARVKQLSSGRYTVCQSATEAKDQTYALYNLTQEQLAHTLMPVGEYTKEEIRRFAGEQKLPVAKKKDSQEICFIPDKDYASFIRKYSGRDIPEGNFVNLRGEVLGRHKGITHYTVGQRKGLNLSMGHPVFVLAIRPDTNEVVIGENEDTYAVELKANQLNFMSVADLPEEREFLAKIRYGHKGTPCKIKRTGADEITCRFLEPVRAVTPGQSIVFYEDGCVAGGGVIL